MIKNIFFDMDGTLLWMDTAEFMRDYFQTLTCELSPLGYTAEELKVAVWKGVERMTLNDGKKCNEEVFWEAFAAATQRDCSLAKDVCFRFYSGNFNKAQGRCHGMEGAKEFVQSLRKKGFNVVLSTSPVFPKEGIESRLHWAGLTPDLFNYVTNYSTESFTKPNPQFFIALANKLGYKPSETIVVGNDEREDMYAAKLAGFDSYLVTDCLLPCKEHPYEGKRGTFAQMKEYLLNLS